MKLLRRKRYAVIYAVHLPTCIHIHKLDSAVVYYMRGKHHNRAALCENAVNGIF